MLIIKPVAYFQQLELETLARETELVQFKPLEGFCWLDGNLQLAMPQNGANLE